MVKVEQGQFRTVWDAIQWVRGRWGVSYINKGMYSLMEGNRLEVKVPRPRSEKADVKQQLAWEKGGFPNALNQAGMTANPRLWHCDEMRFGLWGQVRRR